MEHLRNRLWIPLGSVLILLVAGFFDLQPIASRARAGSWQQQWDELQEEVPP